MDTFGSTPCLLAPVLAVVNMFMATNSISTLMAKVNNLSPSKISIQILATIVKRRLRRKGTTDTSSSTDDLYTSSTKSAAMSINYEHKNVSTGLLSSSVPSSPPVQFNASRMSGRTHGSVSPLALNDSSTDATIQAAMAKTVAQASTGQIDKLDLTPPPTSQQKHRRIPLKINGLGRKRTDRSPLSHDSTKEWTSQDTGLSRFSVSTTLLNQCANAMGRGRASIDNCENYVEEYEVSWEGRDFDD